MEINSYRYISIVKTILMFVLETTAQCFYFAVSMRYFDQFSGTLYNDFFKILIDTIAIFFVTKLLFYLPVYMIVHAIFKELFNTSNIKSSFIHVSTFIGVTLIISVIYPSFVYHSIFDLIALTGLSFLTSVLIQYPSGVKPMVKTN
ncbi:MAG: hypothetical protein EOP45_06505 [Sphingobacteriaceae bacterium]|nr:MAG: hypothetical protein EOP45_06505 [Sphingobacteriaceae bacterium]